MDVAARDRVADPEQLEATIGVGEDRLRPAGDQGLVDLAPLPEREVEVVRRPRAVLDDDLIGQALLGQLR